MNLDKANKRDKKRHKKKYGMRTSGRSVFTIQRLLVKRAEERKKRNK